MRSWNKGISVFAVTLCACSTGAPNANQGQLVANSDAQHFGIGAYVVQNDGATLFDKNGVEIGTMAISSPVAERRVINVELADGTTDEVVVYRPKADGTFFAPITPTNVTTAAAADPALAPLFAQYGVKFHLDTLPLLAPAGGGINPDTVANTTVCNGGCSGGAWTCTTPAGCVRSANTTQCFKNDGTHTACTCGTSGCVACDNVAQLPPSIYSDTGVGAILAYHMYGSTQGGYTGCLNNIRSYCDSTLGAGNYASTSCVSEIPSEGDCIGRRSVSQYVASCARAVGSACTSGQYDAVPRQDSCYDPGSCTFFTGTVGCTTYH